MLASTTVLGALLFFFGRQLASTRMAHFGLDISLLGFSTQDYVVRSADALFLPMGALVLAVLMALGIHIIAMSWFPAHLSSRASSIVIATFLIAGLTLLTLGIAAVFTPVERLDAVYLLTPLSPGLGLALIAYSAYLFVHFHGSANVLSLPLPSWMSAAATGSVVCFIVLSLFWASSDYAKDLGESRSLDLAASLDRQPRVTVFAAKRLAISGPSVSELLLTEEDAAYRYRYTGLRLLLKSGGNYFLLPNGWSRGAGAAIMLNDTTDIRLEFEPGAP